MLVFILLLLVVLLVVKLDETVMAEPEQVQAIIVEKSYSTPIAGEGHFYVLVLLTDDWNGRFKDVEVTFDEYQKLEIGDQITFTRSRSPITGIVYERWYRAEVIQ
jgi:hypothetical protein